MSLAAAAAQSWDQLVAAAKKEGKVVVLGPPDTDVRTALPAAFKKRFGITVEYLGGRGRSTSARIRTERKAGLYTADVAISGITTMARIYYREKMLDPIRPVLILPEVLDGSKWHKGKLWFSDPDDKYILRLSNNVQRSFYINTDKVKPGEIRTARDLFDPKWKGKIAMDDPRISGSGLTMASRFHVAFGDEGVKKFYLGQEPKLTRGRRQLTDWLLRGAYPVVFGADDGKVIQLRKDGFPIMQMNVPDLPQSLSAGYGILGLFNHAPHPNAAKLFINWIASKEGLEVYARARAEVPTRNDINAASFMPVESIPQAGVKYLDTYEWKYVTKFKSEMRRKMKKILGDTKKSKRSKK
jgi:iron(III) transport system substrate-binding protein